MQTIFVNGAITWKLKINYRPLRLSNQLLLKLWFLKKWVNFAHIKMTKLCKRRIFKWRERGGGRFRDKISCHQCQETCRDWNRNGENYASCQSESCKTLKSGNCRGKTKQKSYTSIISPEELFVPVLFVPEELFGH